MVSSHVRPASSVILLLLSDIVVHCTDCSRDIKADGYEGHECAPTLTPGEEKQAAGLLKRAIIQLATGGMSLTCTEVT